MLKYISPPAPVDITGRKHWTMEVISADHCCSQADQQGWRQKHFLIPSFWRVIYELSCRFAVSDQRKIGLDVEIWSIIRFTVTSLILFVGNKGFYFRFLTTELDLNRRRQFKCISNCSGASTHTCIHSYIRVCVLYVSSLSPLTMLTLSPADKHPEEEEKKKKEASRVKRPIP